MINLDRSTVPIIGALSQCPYQRFHCREQEGLEHGIPQAQQDLCGISPFLA